MAGHLTRGLVLKPVPDRDGAIKEVALKDAAALKTDSIAPLNREASVPAAAGRGPTGRDPSDRH